MAGKTAAMTTRRVTNASESQGAAGSRPTSCPNKDRVKERSHPFVGGFTILLQCWCAHVRPWWRAHDTLVAVSHFGTKLYIAFMSDGPPVRRQGFATRVGVAGYQFVKTLVQPASLPFVRSISVTSGKICRADFCSI